MSLGFSTDRAAEKNKLKSVKNAEKLRKNQPKEEASETPATEATDEA